MREQREGRLLGEFNVDPQGPEAYKLEARHVPATEMAALMESAPHQTPRSSQAELLPLRDTLQDAIEQALTPEERWVFDATFAELLSIRTIADNLGASKSSVHRTKQRALRKLRTWLLSEGTMVAYLGRDSNG